MYLLENGLVKLERPSRGHEKISFEMFLFIAFLLSWIGSAPYVLSSWVDETSPTWLVDFVKMAAPLQILMFFGTLIAALLAIGCNYGRAGLKSFGKAIIAAKASLKIYALILIGPAVVFIGAMIISGQLDTKIKPLDFSIENLIGFIPLLLIQLILNTEEMAWRGYALPALQKRYSFLKANIILIIIWAVFHLPLFFMINGHPGGQTLLTFALYIIPIGFVMGAAFNMTLGSIFLVHLLHQSFNAWGEVFKVYPIFNNGSQIPMVLTGIIFIVVAVIMINKIFKS